MACQGSDKDGSMLRAWKVLEIVGMADVVGMLDEVGMMGEVEMMYVVDMADEVARMLVVGGSFVGMDGFGA